MFDQSIAEYDILDYTPDKLGHKDTRHCDGDGTACLQLSFLFWPRFCSWFRSRVSASTSASFRANLRNRCGFALRFFIAGLE